MDTKDGFNIQLPSMASKARMAGVTVQAPLSARRCCVAVASQGKDLSEGLAPRDIVISAFRENPSFSPDFCFHLEGCAKISIHKNTGNIPRGFFVYPPRGVCLNDSASGAHHYKI